jgi:hypothetical protein
MATRSLEELRLIQVVLQARIICSSCRALLELGQSLAEQQQHFLNFHQVLSDAPNLTLQFGVCSAACCARAATRSRAVLVDFARP